MKLRDVANELKERGEKVLVAFLTAGYPNEGTFLELVRAADGAGCDIIEIGIPFSDPIADGPLIQESSKRAIDSGISLRRSIELAAGLRAEVTAPLVFMSYYNPILRMGDERFAEAAHAAGVSGVIIPDVPFEESSPIRSVFRSRDIGYVDLVAPTSSGDRIEAIAREADGFLYLVSVTGVTGVKSPLSRDIEAFVRKVRPKTALPLYIGFGISSAETAGTAVRHGDGVIIGSTLVRLIKSSSSNGTAVENVRQFLKEVKSTIRRTDPLSKDAQS